MTTLSKLTWAESIAESMQSGKLPHVPEEPSLEQSLFPVKLHPRHTTLEGELHAWAGSTLGPRYADDVQNRIQIALFASHFWPCTLDGRILTLLKLMYWFFLVEHEVDENGAASTAEDKMLQAEKAACRGVLQALLGAFAAGAAHAAGPEGAATPQPPVVAVALEWWAAMRQDGMSVSQQARLIAEVSKYLQSLKLERQLTIEPAPSLEVYIPLRRDTAAGGMMCMAAEYGLGIELDEEALSSPLILQLHDAVIDHAFWINDIYSFPKEFYDSECLNLVYLLHSRNNTNSATLVPFPVAVSQAWEMVQARQRDCARLAQQIALSPMLASKPGLLSYVEALCLLTSGIWAWCTQTNRYNADRDQALAGDTSPSRSTSPLRPSALPTKLSSLNIRSVPFCGGNAPLSLSLSQPIGGGLVVMPFRPRGKAPLISPVSYITRAQPFTSSHAVLTSHAISFACERKPLISYT